MSHSLSITVLKDRYPTTFCTPKNSRHVITSRYFLPTHRVSRKIEFFTVILPNRADLIHSVNRIPVLTKTPYVISFEFHLPRYYGGERTRLFAAMRRRLAAPQCRRIIAYSQYAKHVFLATHEGADEASALADKLEVIYPNLALPEWAPASRSAPTLTLVFIGAHFGRKGGAVAARAAEIARRRKLPLHFHIVSSLVVGASVWTDPRDAGFFEPYFKLLDAENVTFYRSLPNSQVIDLLRRADFSILTTLSDTFGFSAVELLAVGTPVLVTSQGALPEFITDGENGLMLQLATDAYGEWIHVGRSDKDSRRFEALYRDEIERLSEQLISRIEPFCIDRIALEEMSCRSRQTAEGYFNSNHISPRLDQLYTDSAR